MSLDAPETIVITGDSMRIEQALTNIVANGVKFSPAGGAVRVAVADRDGMVAIMVVDPGIGIAAGELPNLARPLPLGRWTVTARKSFVGPLLNQLVTGAGRMSPV